MSVNSFDNYPMSWRPSLDKTQGSYAESLVRQLEQDIANGALLPGTKLPPQRELADYLDINLSTVQRAFKLCSQRGLLTSSVGNGTFVAYDANVNLFEKPAMKKEQLIDLGSLHFESIEERELMQQLQQMTQEQDIRQFTGYLRSGKIWWKDAARRALHEAGCEALPEQLLVAGGGQNALAAIFTGVFQKGDRLGVDPLIQAGLISAAHFFGIQLVPISQENGEMTEAGIRYAVKNERIRGLYVMPERQNPTNTTMSIKNRKRIAHLSKEFGLTIIEDGIYNLYCSAGPTIYSMAPEQTIFYLSLSRAISSTLRIAYIAAGKKYVQKLDEALYTINLSQSALLMELTSRMIVSGKAKQLAMRRLTELERRNKITDEILRGYLMTGDRFTHSRWLNLPGDMTGRELEIQALERGVFVYGSERFTVGKNTPVRAARLAICAPNDCEELRNGLKIIGDILQSHC